MDSSPMPTILFLLTLTSCADKSVGDTGSTCPDLTGVSCSEPVYFICDECEMVYVCGRYNGDDLIWGRSDWACECVGDSGQLLDWNAVTQTGNPNCIEGY